MLTLGNLQARLHCSRLIAFLHHPMTESLHDVKRGYKQEYVNKYM